jgi:hypothetical protein
MINRPALLLSLALTVCSGGSSGGGPPPPPRATINPLDYLAASVCPDGSPPLDCAAPVPMTAATPLTYRRGDYGNVGNPQGIYQLVDAVLSASGGSAILDWDFSGYGPAYGGAKFTPKRGDGGEIYVVGGDGVVRAPATEDGGTPGVQYFCGVADGGTGWIDFADTAPTGSWDSAVAKLKIAHDAPTPCPLPLGSAFTRWRRETLPVMFTIAGRRQTLGLDCVIGEHYGGAALATAVTMEQGVWCKNWGRVWFAAYARGPAGPAAQNVSAAFAPWPAPPERPDVTLQDSRLWTHVIATPGGGPQSAFGWPPAGVAP